MITVSFPPPTHPTTFNVNQTHKQRVEPAIIIHHLPPPTTHHRSFSTCRSPSFERPAPHAIFTSPLSNSHLVSGNPPSSRNLRVEAGEIKLPSPMPSTSKSARKGMRKPPPLPPTADSTPCGDSRRPDDEMKNDNNSSMRKRARVGLSLAKSVDPPSSFTTETPTAPQEQQSSTTPRPPTTAPNAPNDDNDDDEKRDSDIEIIAVKEYDDPAPAPPPVQQRTRRSRFIEGSMRDRPSVHPPHDLFLNLPLSAQLNRHNPRSSNSSSSNRVSTETHNSLSRFSTSTTTPSQKRTFTFGINLNSVLKFSPIALVGEVKSAWQRQKAAHEARERRKREMEERRQRELNEKSRLAEQRQRELNEQYQRMKAAGEFKPSFPTPESYNARATAPPVATGGTPERLNTAVSAEGGSARKRRWDGVELVPPPPPPTAIPTLAAEKKQVEDEDMPDAEEEDNEEPVTPPVDTDDMETTFARQLRELDQSTSTTANNSANTSTLSFGVPGKPNQSQQQPQKALTKRELKRQERLAKKVSNLEDQLARAKRELEATMHLPPVPSLPTTTIPPNPQPAIISMPPPPLPRKASTSSKPTSKPTSTRNSLDSSPSSTKRATTFFTKSSECLPPISRLDRQRKTRSTTAAQIPPIPAEIKQQRRVTMQGIGPDAVELEAPLTEEPLVGTEELVRMLRERTDLDHDPRHEDEAEKWDEEWRRRALERELRPFNDMLAGEENTTGGDTIICSPQQGKPPGTANSALSAVSAVSAKSAKSTTSAVSMETVKTVKTAITIPSAAAARKEKAVELEANIRTVPDFPSSPANTTISPPTTAESAAVPNIGADEQKQAAEEFPPMSPKITVTPPPSTSEASTSTTSSTTSNPPTTSTFPPFPANATFDDVGTGSSKDTDPSTIHDEAFSMVALSPVLHREAAWKMPVVTRGAESQGVRKFRVRQGRGKVVEAGEEGEGKEERGEVGGV
ncbi:hypothetical protein EX30DRAFT_244609 [Ascodesmis nigricans]|uniref:Uncharacterized protein n=1 Tax=Ascodesmis nigricans TaxID=341454 RepID=A0A4S2MIB9_9PEZI|nr:hypothetical protein EX30DRAFT_244609 [Ascodesmis nigricans]